MSTTPADSTNATEPQAVDPERDIDAKTTSIVLVISALFVFGSVWVMSYIFAEVVFHQRVERVERAPTVERTELQAQEALELQAGEGRTSIEDAMRAMAEKK